MGHTLREALAAFRRAPLLTGLSAGLMALSLFVVGLFGIAAYNISRVLDQVEAKVEVVAYLRDDARTREIAAAQQDLAAMPEVREVFFISREQALELARRELSEDFRAIFIDLDVNPLPASLEIRLNPAYRNAESLRMVAQAVTAYPFVEEVQFGREWVDKVFLLRRVAGAASGVLGVTFAAIAALIIGAAVRIAIFARRDEIAIMRLVGATDGFIRRPFLLEGLITGLAGGLLALLATFAIYSVLSGSVVELEWIPADWVAGGVVAGALLGALASWAAVRRYLRDV